MKIGFSTNALACQPLRFGTSRHSKKNPVSSQSMEAPKTVSKAEYDKLNAKYELACRLAVAQAAQYNKFVANSAK